MKNIPPKNSTNGAMHEYIKTIANTVIDNAISNAISKGVSSINDASLKSSYILPSLINFFFKLMIVFSELNYFVDIIFFPQYPGSTRTAHYPTNAVVTIYVVKKKLMIIIF